MKHQATVGIIGGGQLGRMLGLAAIPMNVHCIVVDPSPDAPAGRAAEHLIAPFDDADALDELARRCDVITFEFENVGPATLDRLTKCGTPVWPRPAAIALAQDRWSEKSLCHNLGIATARTRPAHDADELHDAVEALGRPCIVKTARLGYDGKGQHRIGRHEAFDAATIWRGLGEIPVVVEAMVSFRRELSIIAVRGDGNDRLFPLAENVHRDGILHRSTSPASVAPALQAQAERIASSLLDALDYRGVLAIECFDVDGELLVNELAPRVHNSGHWTIEGAATSQFANHLRAVLGWPIGDTTAHGPTAMVNCIGSMPDASSILRIDGAAIHDYEKAARPGRKVGHITVQRDDQASLEAAVTAIEEIVEQQRLSSDR